MERKTFKKRFSKTNRPKRKCRFCKTRITIDYKNGRMLQNFVGDSARILPSAITGTCARHQRALTTAIKRARQIALLPYTV